MNALKSVARTQRVKNDNSLDQQDMFKSPIYPAVNIMRCMQTYLCKKYNHLKRNGNSVKLNDLDLLCFHQTS